MDGHKSQTKLARTHSSLLRSSPTIRSSIHSFSSVSEIEETVDVEEQKLHGKPCNPPVRSNASRFVPLIVFLLLSAYTLFAFFYWDELTTSENLLLSLIFVAVLLVFVVRNKVLVVKSVVFCKQLGGDCGKRLGLSCYSSSNQSKPVEWFIGESSSDSLEEDQENVGDVSFIKIVRESVEFYSNGDVYEGEFYKGRCNGSGVYNFIVNGRYEGDWVDGKYEGYGIENWARGSRYKGQYRQGLRHGYGVYKFYTGDTYAGEWCNGQSHGVGMQSCADGSCYVGEFKCGVKHGLGCYHFRNGDRYAGEYFGDKIHGFGVYHFANGHCYEGSWHEGCKQGYGMYTFRNGANRSGEWDFGNLKTPCPPLTDGANRSGEWDFGNLKTPCPPLTDAVLRAVQAARKTADNALHLRRVDKNVDRAVAAANKAATAARVAAVKAVQNRIHQKFCDTNSR